MCVSGWGGGGGGGGGGSNTQLPQKHFMGVLSTTPEFVCGRGGGGQTCIFMGVSERR